MRVPLKIAIPVITVIDLIVSASAAGNNTKNTHASHSHEIGLFLVIFAVLGLAAILMHLRDTAKDRAFMDQNPVDYVRDRIYENDR